MLGFSMADFKLVQNAEDAREVTNKAVAENKNFQVNIVLDRVRRAAQNGDSFVVIDEQHIQLFDEDYKTLSDLGFDVQKREVTQRNDGMTYITFPVIRW